MNIAELRIDHQILKPTRNCKQDKESAFVALSQHFQDKWNKMCGRTALTLDKQEIIRKTKLKENQNTEVAVILFLSDCKSCRAEVLIS